MKHKALILFLILPLLLPGCDRYKDSPGPGEPFFCKINGKVFRPEKDDAPVGWGGASPLRTSWDKNNGWLAILTRNGSTSIVIVIKLSEKLIVREGEYSLSDDLSKTKAYLNLNNSKMDGEELISKSGKVTITKADNYHFSGTFYFFCKSPKTGKEYQITEGQFNDLTYY